MPKAGGSLMSEVVAGLPRRGPAQWQTLIAGDLAQELEQIKRQFVAGKIPNATRTGLAMALAKSLKARGIQIGFRGVDAWLKQPS